MTGIVSYLFDIQRPQANNLYLIKRQADNDLVVATPFILRGHLIASAFVAIARR